MYASIHPLNRKMEWKCKRNKMTWLHDDICPTVTANEFRGVGNVIWEVEDEQDNRSEGSRHGADGR